MVNEIANLNKYRTFAVPDLILLATDLEEDIGYLLPHAMAQARASNASLILAHVVMPMETLPLDARSAPGADAREMEQEARQTLEEIATKVRTSGIPCDVLVRHGSPIEIIPDLVKTTEASRLILGTHGRRHLKKLVLGSVANQILHRVDIPVCTIGPHAISTSLHDMPKKILYPTSLVTEDEQSSQIALGLAQYHQAEITLLHILDRNVHRNEDPEQIAEWTRSEMQRLIPEEARLWISSTIQVEVGTVVEQILNVAAEMQADLIVLGTGKSSSFWPMNEDNTAYEIIAQAKCPVLTLRRPTPGKGLAAEPESMAMAHLWVG